MLVFFFGQKKVVEKTTLPAKRLPRFVTAMGSKYHFFIFWGFIVITIGSVETLIQGLFPSFSLLALIGDTLGGALYVIDRRLLGAGPGHHRVRVLPAHRAAAAPDPDEPRRRRDPRRDRAADDLVFRHALRRLAPLVEVSWWAHVVILLAFLNYLLYSKHSHILAALPNIYFRNLGQRGVLPKLNIEADDMAATGVVKGWKDFTWKSLLDGYACTECARCTNFCPAYNTGKPLSPMQVVHDLRDDLRFAHARPRAAGRAARPLPARRTGRSDEAEAASR